jgi:hypothetical protein
LLDKDIIASPTLRARHRKSKTAIGGCDPQPTQPKPACRVCCPLWDFCQRKFDGPIAPPRYEQPFDTAAERPTDLGVFLALATAAAGSSVEATDFLDSLLTRTESYRRPRTVAARNSFGIAIL